MGVGFLVLVVLHTVPPTGVALAMRTWWDVRALQAASEGNEARVTEAARALVWDARMWRAELAPVVAVTPYLGWVPQYGGDFLQAAALLSYANELVNAAEPTLKVYEQLDARLARQDSFGTALIGLGKDERAQLGLAREKVKMLQRARAAIAKEDLSPQAHGFLRNADRVVAEWDGALRLLESAPALLGEDAPRYYLVLAQNNDEVRPTGGFISAVGVLRVARGDIGVEWFGDSFAADDLSLIHPPPPEPLQKYMWASQWLLRDVNWSADFPTTARKAQEMVAYDRHLKTDGVIAVDVRFLPRLVSAIGNVELAGQPLAQDNVIGLLKESWKPMPPGDMSAAWFESDRKNFLSELLNGMLTRFRAGDVKTGALAQALWRGLREKSVQIYLKDAAAEQAVLDAGWGGAVTPGDGDTLFVVDSNVGFNKVNARVTREVVYDVNVESGDALVTVTYTNPSRAAAGECDLLKQHKDNTYASMEQSCYWNYVRVIAPPGSEFVSAEGVQDAGVVQELDRVTTFGGYTVIPRNTVREVAFRYRLPVGVVKEDVYSLTLQQQAGMPPTPITVRVRVPKGKVVRGATHAYAWEDGSLVFRMTLREDTELRVFLR